MNKRLLLPLVLATVCAGTANATIIGSAVNVLGTTIDGGTAGNPINFYIPLSENASGVYGAGAGQSSDTCSTSSYASDKCGGGLLGMLIEFEGVSAGSNVMTLQFSDLDLVGVNDPEYFFETLSIFGLSTPTYEFVSSAADPLVTFANHVSQTLTIGVNALSSGNLYFGLLFSSKIDAKGTFYNTEETLVASIKKVSVPEPAALSLLGAGLLAIGFARRRKHRAS